VPTLVVHGTADAVVDPRNGELLAERIPGARLQLVPGCGHLLSWERPELLLDLVREHSA
jgi:3-oxoadipate enol-lactonase